MTTENKKVVEPSEEDLDRANDFINRVYEHCKSRKVKVGAVRAYLDEKFQVQIVMNPESVSKECEEELTQMAKDFEEETKRINAEKAEGEFYV